MRYVPSPGAAIRKPFLDPDIVVVRGCWDYRERLDEFIAWVDGLVEHDSLAAMEFELIEPELGLADVPEAAKTFSLANEGCL